MEIWNIFTLEITYVKLIPKNVSYKTITPDNYENGTTGLVLRDHTRGTYFRQKEDNNEKLLHGD